MERVVRRHPDLRFRTRTAGATDADEFLQHLFRLTIEHRLRGETERGIIAVFRRRLRLPQRLEAKRPHAAVANKGEAIQRGHVRGQNALLAEMAVLQKHAPAVRQTVGKYPMQTVRQTARRQLHAAVSAQMVGREIAVLLQVGGFVGEIHAVAVLRQRADRDLAPVAEGAADGKAARGFIKGH